MYLLVIIACLKRKTIRWQHKESTLLCEEGIFKVEAISNLLVPQSSKITLVLKPPIILEKTRMYCTICHTTNHNVETYRVNRKEDHVPAISKVTTQ
jgi:hypothetical protein